METAGALFQLLEGFRGRRRVERMMLDRIGMRPRKLRRLIRFRGHGRSVHDLVHDLVAIDGFLALDAVSGPWHRIQAFGADLLLTVHASPITAVRHTREGSRYIPQEVGLAIQVSNRQFPFSRQLNFVDGIRGFLDRDILAITQTGGNLFLSLLQSRFEFFELALGHVRLLLIFQRL